VIDRLLDHFARGYISVVSFYYDFKDQERQTAAVKRSDLNKQQGLLVIGLRVSRSTRVQIELGCFGSSGQVFGSGQVTLVENPGSPKKVKL